MFAGRPRNSEGREQEADPSQCSTSQKVQNATLSSNGSSTKRSNSGPRHLVGLTMEDGSNNTSWVEEEARDLGYLSTENIQQWTGAVEVGTSYCIPLSTETSIVPLTTICLSSQGRKFTPGRENESLVKSLCQQEFG